MADDKRERLLSAAKEVFLRYGYKRVSMNDIAEAAGISRPGLYLVFKSKEDVFRGVYRRWVAETIDEIERRVPNLQTFEEQLHLAFDLWAVRAFEAARQSAEAEELMNCTLDFAKDEVKAADEAFGRCLIALISSARRGRRTKAALSPERTARVLVGSIRGFKQSATNAADLRRMVADLLTLTLLA